MDILGMASVAIDVMAQSVTRHIAGVGGYTGAHDEWVEGAPAVGTIQAVIHAPSQQDIRDLPEGIVVDVRWTMWTRAEINPASDEIEWQGERHRILHIWPRLEGGYVKAALGVIRDRDRAV